jgi:hypothetical protein
MPMTRIFLITFILIFCGCNPKNNSKNKIMDSDKLIECVTKAINPKFKTWVLFSNGTYIIIEDSTITDKKKYALDQIHEFGPVFAGSPAGDIEVIKLNLVDGWSVGGHGYGMYTYVHPSEVEVKNPEDIDVGLVGREKRDKDSKDTTIVYVNQ